jgi:hypothetical protein
MMMYQSLSMAARPLSTTIMKTFNEDRENARIAAWARVENSHRRQRAGILREARGE